MISIIIPVYNHERELMLALDSIVAQTYKDVEVIIVDDGSETAVSRKLSAISYQLIHQDNLGAPVARNRGFRESKGEYVIFWDADVIAEPHMLEKMVQTLEMHADASFAYCNFYFGHKKMPARKFDVESLKKNNYITTTSLIRRESIVPFDESLKRFQDWDLWLTMAEKGRFGIWIPEYLFRVLPHDGGMSTWLPRFAYRAPWKWLPFIRRSVMGYEEAKQIVVKKHRLLS